MRSYERRSSSETRTAPAVGNVAWKSLRTIVQAHDVTCIRCGKLQCRHERILPRFVSSVHASDKMTIDVYRLTADETRFPIKFIRTCEGCGHKWHQTTERKSLACPDCGTVGRWSSQLVEITRPSGRLEIDHYERLSQFLPDYTGPVSRWKPTAFYDVPLWSPTYAWLVTTLTESESDVDSYEGRLLLDPTSNVTFESIEVYYDSSTAYDHDHETLIACQVCIDGEEVINWAQPIGAGEGVTHIVGEYCACLTAFELASEMATVLRGFNRRSLVPEVTVYGDTEPVHRQIQGWYSVNEAHLRPFHRRVCELIDETNASHEEIDGNSNPVKKLLPSIEDVVVTQ